MNKILEIFVSMEDLLTLLPTITITTTVIITITISNKNVCSVLV